MSRLWRIAVPGLIAFVLFGVALLPLPGVTAVTVANVLPARMSNRGASIEVEGQPLAKDAEPLNVDSRSILPNYFDVMRLPVLQGRGLTPDQKWEVEVGPGASDRREVSLKLAEKVPAGRQVFVLRAREGDTEEGADAFVAVDVEGGP